MSKDISKKLGYIPEAIMINVPEAFFQHEGKIKGDREQAFRRWYEAMGHHSEDDCFYHFISSVPAYENITHVYVCFRGYVQYKAILVRFIKNEPVMLKDYQHPEPRDWCVTTGPVEKAPAGLTQKGFRGFRYTEHLF